MFEKIQDSSVLTRKREERSRFAAYIVNKQSIDNGTGNRLNNTGTHAAASDYTEIKDGALFTTVAERDAILAASNTIVLPLPYIHNLQFTGGYSGPWSVTWDTNATSAAVGVVLNSNPVTGAVSNLTRTSCTVTDQNVGLGAYVVTVTVTLGSLTASASVNISVPCFVGHVLLETAEGAVAAKDIVVGSRMLQPDGGYSEVVEVKNSILTEETNAEDRRLFADPEEKMVVTFWHKVKFPGEQEEVRAGEHPLLHEVHYPLPLPVYHFKLENPKKDKILIHETEIVAEGWVPVNPA